MGVLVVAFTRILTTPRSHWEMDEILFHFGIDRYEPLAHHPHPPGYPLLISLGKLLNAGLHDPFVSLVVLAFVSACAGFIGLAVAFRRFSKSEGIGVLGALLFYMCAAMLVHSMTPMSDPPAIAFLAIALALSIPGERMPEWGRMVAFGVACSASIGCRPQYAVAILPMFLAVVVVARGWRPRLGGLAAFTLASLAWFLPLVRAVGGLDAFVRYQAGQATGVVASDAGIARGFLTFAGLMKRFVVYAWGPRDFGVLILLLAAIGVVLSIRRRFAAWPVALMALVHLVFTVAVCDPADGIRYALPFQMAVAFFLAVTLFEIARRVRFLPVAAILGAVIILISLRTAGKVTIPRLRTVSPPVQAARWANWRLPAEAVILCDQSLSPHRELLMPEFRAVPIEAGLREVWNRPDLEVWILVDGYSDVEGTQVFSWPESREYQRLTRNHYRVVSLVPLEPARRYLPMDGVYSWEWSPNYATWRWLDVAAEIRVPPGGPVLELVVEMPSKVPMTENQVRFVLNGVEATTIVLHPRERRTIRLDAGSGEALLGIESSQSFVPARDFGGRDPRRLAIRLLDLRRTS